MEENRITSISEIQDAIKRQLEQNVWFAKHDVPILCENSKTIEFEIKSKMSALGITATIATPALTYRGDWPGDAARGLSKQPFWEITGFNVVIVENPTLNRGRVNYATALDTALQVAYSLSELPQTCLNDIRQSVQGGLVVVTVSLKTNIAFMLEKEER